MKIKIGNELIAINILVVILVIAITLFPSNVLHLVLGLPFLLFFPGYTLIAALFPKRESISTLERMAFSFVMSVILVPLIGLILNYTPWGVRLYPTLISVAIFIFVMSLIGWYRRHRLADVERFTISFNFNLTPRGGQGFLDRILSIALVAAIVVAIGTLGYAIAAPKVGERFTEFYILGAEGKATNYPKELVLGEEAKVIVGIVNREYETISYRVEITINGTRQGEIGPVVLQHEAQWEQEVSFTPTRSGDDQKVEFLLYKQEQSETYRSLHLWVNVK